MLASVRRYQRFVSSKLAEFLQCDVHYTVRCVLPAETARMYRGNVDGMCRCFTGFIFVVKVNVINHMVNLCIASLLSIFVKD